MQISGVKQPKLLSVRELKTLGLETVTILGQPHALQRIDEDFEIPALGFSATNRFWVRPDDGLVLQSQQYLTPELALKIVHLRPDWETAR